MSDRFPHALRLLASALCAALIGLWLPAVAAHETDAALANPGFRPDSTLAQGFIEQLGDTTIAVYPSLVRRANRTAVSFASRSMIVDTLNSQNIATAVVKNKRYDRGRMAGGSQWVVFEESLGAIGDKLSKQSSDVDYHLIMEFLLPQSDQRIFGVHVYVLDSNGDNAFSFLLNDHHQLFRDANLVARNDSEEARLDLIERATHMALHALEGQIALARECVAGTRTAAVVPQKGVVDDFEAKLIKGSDRYDIPLGFVTFGDEASTVEISTTHDYPTLPPKPDTNSVLRLQMTVESWGGFVHSFLADTQDQWVTQDWSPFVELAFWFHGTNSNTRLFVDILDNRGFCSMRDDAERFTYEFIDDFSGWERITVPFSRMKRKDIGNGAPDDGLTLSDVHGWAIGALNTNGPRTFYIDDVHVRARPRAASDYPINERPMFGEVTKTADQLRADKIYIEMATKGGRSREEAAEMAAKTGWNAFYKGDHATAIKRFNQAWLLDPDNQLALWGFAVISGERKQAAEAVRFFDMAFAAGPSHPSLERDYQFALKELSRSAATPGTNP